MSSDHDNHYSVSCVWCSADHLLNSFFVFISRPLPYLRLDTLPCRLGMPESNKLLWTLRFCLQTRRLLLGLGFLHSYRWHYSDVHLCSLLGASWNSHIEWQSTRRNRRRKKPYLPPLTPVGTTTSAWISVCFPLTGQADPLTWFYHLCDWASCIPAMNYWNVFSFLVGNGDQKKDAKKAECKYLGIFLVSFYDQDTVGYINLTGEVSNCVHSRNV